jgi:muconolactone delta-isomerase
MEQYMVDFMMPTRLTDAFTNAIPKQRQRISQYFAEGKMLSYAVSLEKSRVWAVFTAQSESEVRDMVEALPLTKFMPDYDIHLLTFYNLVTSEIPSFSIN